VKHPNTRSKGKKQQQKENNLGKQHVNNQCLDLIHQTPVDFIEKER
jgi:hypothetical protein